MGSKVTSELSLKDNLKQTSIKLNLEMKDAPSSECSYLEHLPWQFKQILFTKTLPISTSETQPDKIILIDEDFRLLYVNPIGLFFVIKYKI